MVSRCARSDRIASRDFWTDRVVGIRIRCEVRERVARKSSMIRWPMPRPTPLGFVLVGFSFVNNA